MDLGSMTLSDLRLLRDRLDVLAEAGEVLLRLPSDGCAMRFDVTPDELVVITTHWRAPSAPEADAAPDFEVVAPETPLAAVEAQGVRERIAEMFAGVVPPCAAATVDPALQDSDAQATAVDAAMAKLDAAGPEAGCAEVGGGEGVTVQAVASDPSPAPSEIISAAPTPAAETVAPASPADAPQPTPAEAAPEAAPAGDRAGLPWTAADDQRLEQLRAAGKSVRDCAEALGRPVPATQMRLSRLRKPDGETRLTKTKRDTSGPAAAAQKPVKPAALAEAPKRTGEAPVREAAQKIPAQGAQAGRAVSKPAAGAGAAGDHSQLANGGTVLGGGGLVGERAPQDTAPRPAWFREIDATLTAIGYRGGFTPAIDLAIVECIAGQNAPEVVADELGMEVRTMRERFVQLTPDCVDRHGRRKVTVEDQARLLTVLRARAEGGAK
ncbi:hypothetical protein U717_04320 [Rhodobacter capsulatus R121]|nr:hypothetical protein U714_04315 [Rhodobacter capsulatus DE442]ETD79057.1 hypothetical protein U717_04320 [Rhodobacter capsulatus R121]ETE54972.1 hypothetical protein U715_04310 [Rhodobacter capsulatus Y262]